jgi:hypothetical protein
MSLGIGVLLNVDALLSSADKEHLIAAAHYADR